MFSKLFRRNVTIEQQLANVSECGVTLVAGTTIDALFEEWSREDFASDPYRLLLIAMGSDEPTLSENIWHFDTECIEDHGDYVRIAERLRLLADGALPLKDIEDVVDIEQGEASLSFTLDGDAYTWKLEVEDDWVDPNVFTRFVELLEERDTDRRFTLIDLDGQDCLIGCATDEQRQKLADVTGLNVGWLT